MARARAVDGIAHHGQERQRRRTTSHSGPTPAPAPAASPSIGVPREPGRVKPTQTTEELVLVAAIAGAQAAGRMSRSSTERSEPRPAARGRLFILLAKLFEERADLGGLLPQRVDAVVHLPQLLPRTVLFHLLPLGFGAQLGVVGAIVAPHLEQHRGDGHRVDEELAEEVCSAGDGLRLPERLDLLDLVPEQPDVELGHAVSASLGQPRASGRGPDLPRPARRARQGPAAA
mmetsp:Transcript_13237/g.33777  ORF Transcript_13237/g.33777 Transcript_13237/m.33777 type:complete len:231 (-) Transcript_13237:214-906(-)